MNNSQSFKESLALDAPDEQLPFILKSLWYDAKGDWKTAHDLVDQLPGSEAAWVHAYLHRKEGDNWNSDYWYAKAKKTRPNISLEAEWESLVTYFLAT
ncbi:hypothetical protein [Aquirufa sp.]|jgi:uncharacterized protein (DUF2267 family)|uniref:hypothetical protein n=1 Tax=Aquirufa sp. TaxID=2676249 RepID=UPI0037BF1D81